MCDNKSCSPRSKSDGSSFISTFTGFNEASWRIMSAEVLLLTLEMSNESALPSGQMYFTISEK